MKYKKPAATIAPSKGDITQEEAISAKLVQFNIENPALAIPAPITPPTIACVVETGAPIEVAKFNQTAPAKRPAVIAQINEFLSEIRLISIIPLFIVFTTSPPAIIAPALSNIAAIIMAPVKVNAFAPTAGPTLFATSFAPIFNAI